MKSFISVILTAILLSTHAHAVNLRTVCEQVAERTFACDTWPIDDSISLISQTWQVQYGATIEGQGTGYLVAHCANTTTNGQFSYIAALSDGSTESSTGTLPCRTGGSTGSPGPGSGCFGRVGHFGECTTEPR